MKTNPISHRQTTSQLHPALKAALVFLSPVIILRFVSSLLASTQWLWLLIFGVIYILNGYMAGRFYAESVYHVRVRRGIENARQQGAGAGILLFLLGWVGYAVLMVLVNFFVLLIPTVQFGTLFVCGGFVEFWAAMGLGAFGASRYR